MGWLFGKQQTTRGDVARAAARALKRRKFKQALGLYEDLLARQPGDRDLQRRIASLQARTGAAEDAWVSFRFAAEAYTLEGFDDKAIGVYREATHFLPEEAEVWCAIADIHLDRDRPSDAVAALAEGRAKLTRRRHRPGAIRLLERIRQIRPTAFEPALDLARLYARTGAGSAAYDILVPLEATATPHQRARVRREIFRRRPIPGNGWRWLRAALRARGA